jgi:hypothetical protein
MRCCNANACVYAQAPEARNQADFFHSQSSRVILPPVQITAQNEIGVAPLSLK